MLLYSRGIIWFLQLPGCGNQIHSKIIALMLKLIMSTVNQIICAKQNDKLKGYSVILTTSFYAMNQEI